MAEIEPLRALRYNPDRTDGLQNVVAPPYDVIDDDQRQELLERSPYNVVAIDLPEAARTVMTGPPSCSARGATRA